MSTYLRKLFNVSPNSPLLGNLSTKERCFVYGLSTESVLNLCMGNFLLSNSCPLFHLKRTFQFPILILFLLTEEGASLNSMAGFTSTRLELYNFSFFWLQMEAEGLLNLFKAGNLQVFSEYFFILLSSINYNLFIFVLSQQILVIIVLLQLTVISMGNIQTLDQPRRKPIFKDYKKSPRMKSSILVKSRGHHYKNDDNSFGMHQSAIYGWSGDRPIPYSRDNRLYIHPEMVKSVIKDSRYDLHSGNFRNKLSPMTSRTTKNLEERPFKINPHRSPLTIVNRNQFDGPLTQRVKFRQNENIGDPNDSFQFNDYSPEVFKNEMSNKNTCRCRCNLTEFDKNSFGIGSEQQTSRQRNKAEEKVTYIPPQLLFPQKSNSQNNRKENLENRAKCQEIIKKVRNFNEFLIEVKKKFKYETQIESSIAADSNSFNLKKGEESGQNQSKSISMSLRLENEKIELEKYKKLVERELSKQHSIQSISVEGGSTENQRIIRINYESGSNNKRGALKADDSTKTSNSTKQKKGEQKIKKFKANKSCILKKYEEAAKKMSELGSLIIEEESESEVNLRVNKITHLMNKLEGVSKIHQANQKQISQILANETEQDL